LYVLTLYPSGAIQETSLWHKYKGSEHPAGIGIHLKAQRRQAGYLSKLIEQFSRHPNPSDLKLIKEQTF